MRIFVIAANSEVPSTALTRALVPLLSALICWRPMRNLAVRRLA
jgi:hypothetical protein